MIGNYVEGAIVTQLAASFEKLYCINSSRIKHDRRRKFNAVIVIALSIELYGIDVGGHGHAQRSGCIAGRTVKESRIPDHRIGAAGPP